MRSLEVMRSGILLTAIALGGCPTGPPTHIIPLAELEAQMQLGPDDRFGYESRSFRLVPPENGVFCQVLSPRDTRVTMDGSQGEHDPGGPKNFSDARECWGPSFSWDSSPSGAPTTFVVSDRTASWTFVVWDPFASNRFELVSHERDEVWHVGDTVELQLEPGGTIANPRVRATDSGKTLFDFTEGNGLTRNGGTLTFVVPQLEPAETVSVQVSADFEYRFDRCDASLGCESQIVLDSNYWVDFAATP